jgi:hypothetical protein
VVATADNKKQSQSKMPVIVVSNDQDPRRRPAVAHSSFHYNPAEFPELPHPTVAPDVFFRPLSDGPHSDVQELSDWSQNDEISGKNLLYDCETKADCRNAVVAENYLESHSAPEVASSNAANLSASFNRFLELPIELREVIWELGTHGTVHRNGSYLITPVEVRDYVKAPNKVERPYFLPPMCRVSKSTMSETTGVFVRNSEFMIASYNDNLLLDSYLKTVPKGYEAIRLIHFAFFDCFPEGFPQNADLELAVRCTGLRTIKIRFHSTRLIVWVLLGDYDDGLTCRPRRIDEMWAHYKFARLLECVNLQNLIIERKGCNLDAALEASENLGIRIQEEYLRKNQRTLNVTLI